MTIVTFIESGNLIKLHINRQQIIKRGQLNIISFICILGFTVLGLNGLYTFDSLIIKMFGGYSFIFLNRTWRITRIKIKGSNQKCIRIITAVSEMHSIINVSKRKEFDIVKWMHLNDIYEDLFISIFNTKCFNLTHLTEHELLLFHSLLFIIFAKIFMGIFCLAWMTNDEGSALQ